MKSYQKALGQSIAKADRAAQVFSTAAYKAGFSKQPPPKQWLPNGKKKSMPKIPKAVDLATAIYALDAAWDAERAYFWYFDMAFDVTYAAVPATAWETFDVYADLAHCSRAELAYVYNTYLSDVSFYADVTHVAAFEAAELAAWSDGHAFDYYGEDSAQLVELDWETSAELAALEDQYGIDSELENEAAWDADAEDLAAAEFDDADVENAFDEVDDAVDDALDAMDDAVDDVDNAAAGPHDDDDGKADDRKADDAPGADDGEPADDDDQH